MEMHELLRDLPGEIHIRHGLEDLAQEHFETRNALLVTIAAERLRTLGLPVPTRNTLASEPELKLYEILRHEPGDAYLRYNALIQQLVSFTQALEGRLGRLRAGRAS